MPSRSLLKNSGHWGRMEPAGPRPDFPLYVNMIFRAAFCLVFILIYRLNTQTLPSLYQEKSFKGKMRRAHWQHSKGEETVEDGTGMSRGSPLQCQTVSAMVITSFPSFPQEYKGACYIEKKVRIMSRKYPSSIHGFLVWCFDQYILNRHKKVFELVKMKGLWESQTPGRGGDLTLKLTISLQPVSSGAPGSLLVQPLHPVVAPSVKCFPRLSSKCFGRSIIFRFWHNSEERLFQLLLMEHYVPLWELLHE